MRMIASVLEKRKSDAEIIKYAGYTFPFNREYIQTFRALRSLSRIPHPSIEKKQI
jgi:hypothetical protein